MRPAPHTAIFFVVSAALFVISGTVFADGLSKDRAAQETAEPALDTASGADSPAETEQAGTPSETSMASISKEEIRAVIREHTPEIKACYERLLASDDPNLSGKIVLSWWIGGDGSTSNIVVKENTVSTAMEGCLTEIVGQMVFEKPAGAGDISVTYPFIFETGG